MEWSVEDHIHFSALEFGILDNNIRWSGQLNIISTFSAIEIGILNNHNHSKMFRNSWHSSSLVQGHPV